MHYRVNETLGEFTKSVVTSGVQRLTIVIMEPVVRAFNVQRRGGKVSIWQMCLPNSYNFNLGEILEISFLHHRLLLSKYKVPGI